MDALSLAYGIYQDDSLYGHGLNLMTQALNTIATSDNLYSENSQGIKNIKDNSLKYLGLGFRRIIVRSVAIVAIVVLNPLSFAIKLIHLIGRYVSSKLIGSSAEHKKVNVSAALNGTFLDVLEKIDLQNIDYSTAKCFIKINYEEKILLDELTWGANINCPVSASKPLNKFFHSQIKRLPNTCSDLEVSYFFIFNNTEAKTSDLISIKFSRQAIDHFSIESKGPHFVSTSSAFYGTVEWDDYAELATIANHISN